MRRVAGAEAVVTGGRGGGGDGGGAEAVKEGKDQRGKARRSGAAKQQDGDV